jgi:hypothetical protein
MRRGNPGDPRKPSSRALRVDPVAHEKTQLNQLRHSEVSCDVCQLFRRSIAGYSLTGDESQYEGDDDENTLPLFMIGNTTRRDLGDKRSFPDPVDRRNQLIDLSRTE